MHTRSKVWRPLTGPAERLVLAVDFALTGRPDATFTELADRLGQEWEIWETIPPLIGPESGWDAADYVAHWTADVPSERAVHAVLGFCGGAIYAGLLAGTLADRQPQPPRLLVFDPESPSSEVLYHQFRHATEMLRDVLGDERVDDAWSRAREQFDRTGPDIESYGATLVGVYLEVAHEAFAAVGLDDLLAAELTNTYRAFVRYQVASGQVAYESLWTEATVFCSSNAAYSDIGGDRAPAARELFFDVSHVDLLRDPAVVLATASRLD